MSEITIRRAETPADYRACQRAQRLAWGITDDSYIIPVATMVGAQLHGGLVLGAFLPDGDAVGMSFAFLGRVEEKVCLYSQLTGIVPGYQDRGVGYQLKTTQRDLARESGVDWIAWAFDPLQAGNARFNLDKLAATAVRYIADMYGTRSDSLNLNTPTDRLIALWSTDPETERREHPDARDLPRPIALVSAADPHSPPEPTYAGLPESAPGLLLEIPDSIQELRSVNPSLAGRWGAEVRQAFVAAFAAGYQATGFLREETPSGRRCYYVLRPTPKGSADHSA